MSKTQDSLVCGSILFLQDSFTWDAGPPSPGTPDWCQLQSEPASDFAGKLTTETSKGNQPTWPTSPFIPSSSGEDVVKLSKSSDSYFPACLLLMIFQLLKLTFLHSPIFLSKLEKVRSLLGTEGSCFRNDYSSAVVAGGYHNRQVQCFQVELLIERFREVNYGLLMVKEMSFTILSPLMDEVSTAEKRNNSKRVATLFAKDPAILLYNGTKNQKILFALLMVHSSKTPCQGKSHLCQASQSMSMPWWMCAVQRFISLPNHASSSLRSSSKLLEVYGFGHQHLEN